MAYRFAVRLESFGELPEPEAARLIAAAVQWLAAVDLAWLREHPEAPTLYASGVRYRNEHDDAWSDIPDVLHQGAGDCEDLAAWRLAELWRDGERGARPVVEMQQWSGGIEYHVMIERAGGRIEDPSEALGMR